MPLNKDNSSCTLDELERLTTQAVLAAQQGDWDSVDTCIAKRERFFGQVTIPFPLAVRLRELDGRIEASILLARTATASALADIGRIRTNLQRLQQGSEAYQPAQSSIINISA